MGQQSARNPFHLVSNENMFSFLDHDFNLVSPLKDRLAPRHNVFTLQHFRHGSHLAFVGREVHTGSRTNESMSKPQSPCREQTVEVSGRYEGRRRRKGVYYQVGLTRCALCPSGPSRRSARPSPEGMSRPLNSSPPRTVNEVMTLPAVTLMHPASEKVSRGRTAIFTSFLHHRDYLGPHGTPLAAD